MKKMYLSVILFILLILLVLSMVTLINSVPKKNVSYNTSNIALTNNNKISFDSLTQKQKLSQMIIVRGDKKDLDFTNLNVGGIFLDKQSSEKEYQDLIQEYQNNSKINLFVSTDLEGAWVPKGIAYKFPKFSEINTSEQAYEVGYKHGFLLNRLGFNINFAPVSELSDSAYGGRTFTGTNEEIKQKIESYIQGIQENIFGVCKHYPGNALQVNLHFRKSTETITNEDLELFQACINNNVSGIMISHHISQGELDSNGKPSTVSPEIINSLSEYNGLIIADEINMKGLKNTYPNKRELYRHLINAGNDLILDFDLDSKELNDLLKVLEQDLNAGIISQEQVDKSVKKILEAKKYIIV
jgi:beta-N-acetylhexosaminidase